jgi:hypothetical protein
MTQTDETPNGTLLREMEETQRADEALLRSATLLARAEAKVAQLELQGAVDHADLAELRTELMTLRKAIESRATIEQAKGIIIAATGCDPDEAFRSLAQQSQHENRKLRDVAESLVRSKHRS